MFCILKEEQIVRKKERERIIIMLGGVVGNQLLAATRRLAFSSLEITGLNNALAKVQQSSSRGFSLSTLAAANAGANCKATSQGSKKVLESGLRYYNSSISSSSSSSFARRDRGVHHAAPLAGKWVSVRSLSDKAPGAITEDEPNIKYDKVRNENVEKIASQILQLSLLEVAELTDVLKEKLGIDDEVMMQQLGAHYGGPVVAAAPGEAAPAEEEKTAFDVKLEAFDAGKKLKVIKEVRAITGLGLKEAKELVEKSPSDVKLGVTKEEAEEIQKKLEEVGGTVKVE